MIRYCYVAGCYERKCSWRCGVETMHLTQSRYDSRRWICPNGKSLSLSPTQQRDYNGESIHGWEVRE